MKKIFTLLFIAAIAVSATACSKNPQKRFAEICSKEQDAAKRESCLCTSQELARTLDKTKYEQLVDELEESQAADGSINFQSVIKSDVLDQQTLTAFMAAAKKCGPAR